MEHARPEGEDQGRHKQLKTNDGPVSSQHQHAEDMSLACSDDDLQTHHTGWTLDAESAYLFNQGPVIPSMPEGSNTEQTNTSHEASSNNIPNNQTLTSSIPTEEPTYSNAGNSETQGGNTQLQGQIIPESQANNNQRHTSPTPYQPHQGGVATLLWAPTKGRSQQDPKSFYEWITSYKEIPVDWKSNLTRTALTPNKLLKTIISSNEQMKFVKDKLTESTHALKFTLVSQIPDPPTIENFKTHTKEELAILSPIQIGPLPKASLEEIVNRLQSRGTNPLWGAITNLRQVGNYWEGRIWSPMKRAQILRNAHFENEFVRIFPGLLGVFEEDKFACTIKNLDQQELETKEIEELMRTHATSVPTPSAVVQYFNPITEQTVQKWIVCFNFRQQAEQFARNTRWLDSASRKLEIKPCNGATPGSQNTSQRGRGRQNNKKK
eukprot:TRINITY_DN185_c0_g1_i10.p1 TRINITY_DN185_c0_g1~~TRINITY_DN185_c0_g1_i10.p1  ORF type:complete len:436 (+),score=76.25 TRINITY_DN185_c0_g1_i10:3786-5093(+)